jgi:hypothetical protein
MSTTRHLVLDLSLFSEGQPNKLSRTVYPSEVPGAKSFQADANAVYVADGKPCQACAGKHRAHTCGKGKKELKENKDTVDTAKDLRVEVQPDVKVEVGRDEQRVQTADVEPFQIHDAPADKVDPPPQPLVPLALQRLHRRLSKDLELYKLHVKHYHMSPAQFRKRTSELALPDEVYHKYEQMVKSCKICSDATPPPSRSRFTGLRAINLGDLVFADHAEIHHEDQKYVVLLILDGATNLLWARPQQDLKAESTLESFRDWMDHHNCIPKTVVADMAFMGPVYQTFYRFHSIKTMPTGPRTPWPNRAETAVRLFKRTFTILSKAVGEDPSLRQVTCRQLIRKSVWARNNQLTISGKTPLELSYGRRPPYLLDVETMNSEQLSVEPLPHDRLEVELKRLALKAHLEARQLNDLRHDLSWSVRPSDGPYSPGDRVFFWNQDHSKIKHKGEWVRGKVLIQTGPMVTIEALGTVQKINQPKVRREHDEWHDVPLPRELEQPGSSAYSGTHHETSQPQGDVLALWHNHSSQLMEVCHKFARASAYCARYGLAVVEPIDLNAMPNVNTPHGQTQRAPTPCNLLQSATPQIKKLGV